MYGVLSITEKNIENTKYSVFTGELTFGTRFPSVLTLYEIII